MWIFAHHTVLHSVEMNVQTVIGVALAALAIVLAVVWKDKNES